MVLPETPDEPSDGSEIANKPELNHLNDGILRQAWQNVMEAEKSGKQTSEKQVEDPKEHIEDASLSPKVEYVMEKYNGLEGELLKSIHKNRHRVRELIGQLQEKMGTGNNAVSYDKLFDYLTKELWFPHFARNVKLKSGEAFTKLLNYQITVEEWVDQLMDMFLFQEIKTENGGKLSGGYIFEEMGNRRSTTDRNYAKSFLEGHHVAPGGGQELHFKNLWEYLNDVVARRSMKFHAIGNEKSLTTGGLYEDLRDENEKKESRRQLKEFLEKAPVDIFRHCYFEKAKKQLPKDKTVDLDSEDQIEKFMNWVSNNFVHSLAQGLTKFETPEKPYEPEPSGFFDLMPDFSKLERVYGEIKILYIKNRFRVRIFKTLGIREKSAVAAFWLESQFWDSIRDGWDIYNNWADEGWKVVYDAEVYLRKEWYHIFRSRKKIAAKYDRLQANSDVEQLVTFMKYLFSLYTVAQVYEKSTDPEQQRQAKFYLELVRLYGKQLQQTAVNLEARLKVPQFKPDDLSTAIYTVQSLMNRTVHAEQMQALSEVESDVKLLGEATTELNGFHEEQLADFDQKLEAKK